MKFIKLFIAVTCALAILTSAANIQAGCGKCPGDKKECPGKKGEKKECPKDKKCCDEAKKEGKSCDKCKKKENKT